MNWRSEASSPAPSGHSPTASSAAASASSPSSVYLEPLRISAKERPGFSSATPSQSSSVVPSAVNAPLPSAADPESSKLPEFSQLPTDHSSHLSSAPSTDPPSSKSSPEALAVPGLQPILSASLAVTSSEAQVCPDTLRSTPIQISNLWSRALEEAEGDSDTLKWLQKHGLASPDGKQQMNQKHAKVLQSRTDNHMKELISLIEADELSEQNDKPLKVQTGKREVIVRDYIA